MTIEIDNWLKIPSSASPGGQSLDVAYNMQSMRRIRNLKSVIVNLEVELEDIQEHFVGLGLDHHEDEVTEELEKACASLAEERSHQNNMTPAQVQTDLFPALLKDPDSVICGF